MKKYQMMIIVVIEPKTVAVIMTRATHQQKEAAIGIAYTPSRAS